MATISLILNTFTFCAAAAMLVAAYKAHNIHKTRYSLGFLTSFSLISIGLLLELIATNYTVLYSLLTQMWLSQELLLILSGLSLLCAYTLLLFVVEKQHNISTQIIAAALVVVTTVLATQYFLVVYAVTALVLSLLAANFYNNYAQKRNPTSLMVYVAFTCLLIAHIAALLAPISEIAVILYGVLQLIAYFLLFSMLWRINR